MIELTKYAEKFIDRLKKDGVILPEFEVANGDRANFICMHGTDNGEGKAYKICFHASSFLGDHFIELLGSLYHDLLEVRGYHYEADKFVRLHDEVKNFIEASHIKKESEANK